MTAFLNCNDLPPVRPAIGDSLLRIVFPNKYVSEPAAPNHKRMDPGLKDRVTLPDFRDGTLWLVLDVYKAFIQSGRIFKPIPEVLSETQDANEAEGEDIIDSLAGRFEFARPFTDAEECRRTGFLTKPRVVQDIINDIKRAGVKLKGVSPAGIMTQLKLRGYPKTPRKVRFDAGNGVEYTMWVCGIRVRAAGEGPDGAP